MVLVFGWLRVIRRMCFCCLVLIGLLVIFVFIGDEGIGGNGEIVFV